MAITPNTQNWYPLNGENVTEMVADGPGFYALGHASKGVFLDTTTLKYVGRDDVSIRDRLGDHATTSKYAYFFFKNTQDAEEAYRGECTLYHKFEAKLDNKIHPAVPDNQNLQCYHCQYRKM